MNIYNFLKELRDRVAVGEDKIVSIFLMGDEIRIRIDLNLDGNHIEYVSSNPASHYVMLNDDNMEIFLSEFGRSINARISEWDMGEQ